jgi:hypothetical protein
MIRARPSQIAKFHAGLILRSALNEGWEAPAEYSLLKRARIQRELKKLADKLAATGPNASVTGAKRTVDAVLDKELRP